ncbi:MAG: hypothetical protein LBS82_05260 [Spirochaetaceae bacterium]|jgi:hypothetical protein|nr:hypothetical protein [Spirochaetaceae bacterium]
MTHKFSILRDALPPEVRREADWNVAHILAELDEQERQRNTPVLPQPETAPVKQALTAAHA